MAAARLNKHDQSTRLRPEVSPRVIPPFDRVACLGPPVMESKPQIGQRKSRFQPYQQAEADTSTAKRRGMNDKERRRNQSINDAFGNLQRLIPYVPEPEHQKLARIKTLRLATQYIHFLNELLDEPNKPQAYDCSPPWESRPQPSGGPSDFAQVVASEIQSRNSYKERAEQMIKTASSTPNTESPPQVPYPFNPVMDVQQVPTLMPGFPWQLYACRRF